MYGKSNFKLYNYHFRPKINSDLTFERTNFNFFFKNNDKYICLPSEDLII